MAKRVFTAMIAMAAIAGSARGADNPTVRPGSVLVPTTCPEPQAACPNVDWGCGPASTFWIGGEALLWWTKANQYPALVTTGIPGAMPGVFGQPGTDVIFGGDLDNRMRVGGRFSGGFWLNHCQTIGLEGNYFFLGSRSSRFDSNGALLTRPFFDVLTDSQNAQLVSYPGIATGQIHASTYSRLQGGELNLFCSPKCEPTCDPCLDPCNNPSGNGQNAMTSYSNGNSCNNHRSSVVWFGGFRYLQLNEGLNITETSQVNPALPPGSPLFGGSTITITDQFSTRNTFYGGQIGARAECCWGRVFTNVYGKVAVGVTEQVVDINGATIITAPNGTTVVTPVGFLASGSNSGHFTRDRFSVVSEVGVNLGYQITRHVRSTVGYSFLHWTSVVRPSNQIDIGLSGTQIPTDARFNPLTGQARPGILLNDTDFWAQGISFGLEFRF